MSRSGKFFGQMTPHVACLLAVIFVAALSSRTGYSEWKPEYASQPQEVRDWYSEQELTPETRERLKVSWKSCCKHSDVVKAEFRVDKATGYQDQWFYKLPNGKWKQVPPDTIH